MSSLDVVLSMLCVLTVYDRLWGAIPFVVPVDLLISDSSAGSGGELGLGNVSSTSCSDSCTGSFFFNFFIWFVGHIHFIAFGDWCFW